MKEMKYVPMSKATIKYINTMVLDVQDSASDTCDTDNIHYFVSGMNTWCADKDLWTALNRYKREAGARKGKGFANVWLVRCSEKTPYSIDNWSGAPIVEDHDAIFIAEIHF
jgi:hypothetical protein